MHTGIRIVTEIKIKPKRKRTDAPSKVCTHCLAAIHAAQLYCSHCEMPTPAWERKLQWDIDYETEKVLNEVADRVRHFGPLTIAQVDACLTPMEKTI